MEARCEINKFIQAAAVTSVLAVSFLCPSSLYSLSLSSLLLSSNQQVLSARMLICLEESYLNIKSLLTLTCCNV